MSTPSPPALDPGPTPPNEKPPAPGTENVKEMEPLPAGAWTGNRAGKKGDTRAPPAAGLGASKLNPDAIGNAPDDDPVDDVDAGAAGCGAPKLNPDAIGDAPDDDPVDDVDAPPAAPSCSALAAPFSGALLAAMFPPLLLTLTYLRAAAPSIPAELPVVDVDAGAAGCGALKLNPDAIGDAPDDDPVVDVDEGAAGLGASKLNPDAIGVDAPDVLLAPPGSRQRRDCAEAAAVRSATFV